VTKRLSVPLIAAGVAGLLILVLVQVPASWWRVLASGWRVLLPAAASLAVLLLGVLLRWRTKQENHQASAAPTLPDRQVRPLRSWVIPIGMVVVVAVTGMAMGWLQDTVPLVGDQVQRAQLRVESMRTGLTIGAAVTGAFALLLAFRRQQLAERTQQATEYDAGEKRVTELYVKAADQLGSDKAPVRLAGLYALERLAQDNPVHRQSIVEVICAYLRMPYTPPNHQPKPGTDQPQEALTSHEPSTRATGTDEPTTPTTDPREEHQVRLAAQRILARHLRPETQDGDANPTYWGPNIDLDLTEATLVYADFTKCHLHNADFSKATFSGTTLFSGATFSGTALFMKATFSDIAWFGRATFSGGVVFFEATFNGPTLFSGATFSDDAGFADVTFGADASFGFATFDGDTVFVDSTFSGAADFDGAAFSHEPAFDGATFSSRASFRKATLLESRFEGPPVTERP
jgi:uncharacterized protein YjbI with pentapeptide repeats